MPEGMKSEFLAAFRAEFGFGEMTATANDDAAAMLKAAAWAWHASTISLAKDLESHKRMLLAAACDIGAIGEALGADMDDDGSAIEGLAQDLRKDAERYRWLRDGAGYCDTRDIPGMAPARMDAFIDTAMAKERGQ